MNRKLGLEMTPTKALRQHWLAGKQWDIVPSFTGAHEYHRHTH